MWAHAPVTAEPARPLWDTPQAPAAPATPVTPEPAQPSWQPTAAPGGTPAVEPVTAEPGKPAWAVVEGHQEEEAPAAASEPAQPQPAWEVVGGPMPAALDRRGRGKDKKKGEELPVDAKESSMQTALSYLGLVAALIVVLLGVILMVSSTR